MCYGLRTAQSRVVESDAIEGGLQATGKIINMHGPRGKKEEGRRNTVECVRCTESSIVFVRIFPSTDVKSSCDIHLARATMSLSTPLYYTGILFMGVAICDDKDMS